jgi:hypothetical protein
MPALDRVDDETLAGVFDVFDRPLRDAKVSGVISELAKGAGVDDGRAERLVRDELTKEPKDDRAGREMLRNLVAGYVVIAGDWRQMRDDDLASARGAVASTEDRLRAAITHRDRLEGLALVQRRISDFQRNSRRPAPNEGARRGELDVVPGGVAVEVRPPAERIATPNDIRQLASDPNVDEEKRLKMLRQADELERSQGGPKTAQEMIREAGGPDGAQIDGGITGKRDDRPRETVIGEQPGGTVEARSVLRGPDEGAGLGEPEGTDGVDGANENELRIPVSELPKNLRRKASEVPEGDLRDKLKREIERETKSMVVRFETNEKGELEPVVVDQESKPGDEK